MNLTNDLQNMGLQKGDTVYIHTSLKSMGVIDGGASTFIDSILAAVGEEGTFAVPTHTLSFEKANFGTTPYEKSSTSCKAFVGVFPEIVFNHPKAKRSGHGSHSSAAIGARAEYLTSDHDPTHAMGKSSPLYKLYESNGKILLVGTGFNRCTIIHMAESMAKVPYVKLQYDASWGDIVIVKNNDGSLQAYKQIEFPGCSEKFKILEAKLNDKIKRAFVGEAPAILINARELVDTAVEMLKARNDIFLCDDKNCCCCPPRRILTSS